MARYLVVTSVDVTDPDTGDVIYPANSVVNAILWDGVTEWSPGNNMTVVMNDESDPTTSASTGQSTMQAMSLHGSADNLDTGTDSASASFVYADMGWTYDPDSGTLSPPSGD